MFQNTKTLNRKPLGKQVTNGELKVRVRTTQSGGNINR
jgi:hypothetical protein